MSSFRLFKGLNKTVDPEEIKALTTKLLEYDKLPMPQMTEKLRQLDYNYPKPFGITEFFKSKYFIIGVVVAVILLLLVGIGLDVLFLHVPQKEGSKAPSYTTTSAHLPCHCRGRR